MFETWSGLLIGSCKIWQITEKVLRLVVSAVSKGGAAIWKIQYSILWVKSKQAQQGVLSSGATQLDKTLVSTKYRFLTITTVLLCSVHAL